MSTAQNDLSPLPAFWRRVFWVELPIVALTVLYWIVDPHGFLKQTFAIDPAPQGAVFLLWAYAAAVFTLVFYFYARMLYFPVVHVPTFRAYQEGLLLGDVLIVIIYAWAALSGTVNAATAWASVGMAMFWGTVRVVFLVRTKLPAP